MPGHGHCVRSNRNLLGASAHFWSTVLTNHWGRLFVLALEKLGWLVGRNLPNRRPLDCKRCRAHPEARDRIGGCRPRCHSCPYQSARRLATGHPRRANRVCDSHWPLGSGDVASLARPRGNVSNSFAPAPLQGLHHSSPELIPEVGSTPGFGIANPLSILHRTDRLLSPLPVLPIRACCPDLTATLTTMAFGHSSLQWLEISP